MSGCEGGARHTGRYFKIETLGAVDGPGLRFVLFLQGCPLRCPYCHNPEGWEQEGGERITVQQVLDKMSRYRRYYRRGGITVSGGEPLMQAEFVRELFACCRAEGIHTALDTAGCVDQPGALTAVAAADLLLLDIKAATDARCREQFGFSLSAPLRLLEYCAQRAKPVWLRHVVAPGLADPEEEVLRLAALAEPYSCAERIELLPFRRLCIEKYQERGIPFPLENASEPDKAGMARLRALLEHRLPGRVIE